MGKIKLDGYICERCEHKWAPRTHIISKNNFEPKVCPKCKSPYWDRPRMRDLRKKKEGKDEKK